jgi:nucleoid-associated protein YejK
MALAEAKAIMYKNYDLTTKALVTEIFVPCLSMTLNERWEVRRTQELDINTPRFVPDVSEINNPEYVTFMVSEMKQIEELNKTIVSSKRNITINSMLMNIMKELVKIYDEKVRISRTRTYLV